MIVESDVSKSSSSVVVCRQIFIEVYRQEDLKMTGRRNVDIKFITSFGDGSFHKRCSFRVNSCGSVVSIKSEAKSLVFLSLKVQNMRILRKEQHKTQSKSPVEGKSQNSRHFSHDALR